jgi:hypothetical protein
MTGVLAPVVVRDGRTEDRNALTANVIERRRPRPLSFTRRGRVTRRGSTARRVGAPESYSHDGFRGVGQRKSMRPP